jgi:hypothetical protein
MRMQTVLFHYTPEYGGGLVYVNPQAIARFRPMVLEPGTEIYLTSGYALHVIEDVTEVDRALSDISGLSGVTGERCYVCTSQNADDLELDDVIGVFKTLGHAKCCCEKHEGAGTLDWTLLAPGVWCCLGGKYVVSEQEVKV